MSTTGLQFAQNPYYIAYETQLRQLHRLIAQGKGNSDEANQLREDMEIPFSHLSDEEQERLHNLSGDLYQLQDREVFVAVADISERSREHMGSILRQALRSSDWNTLLAELRKGPDPDLLSQGEIAHLRGTAYWQLGHIETALAFLNYAVLREPNNDEYRESYLQLLLLGGSEDEALTQALQVIEDKNASVNALFLSACALFRKSQEVDELTAAQSIYKQIIAVLNKVLVASVLSPYDKGYFGALILLGHSQDALGLTTEAHESYQKALTESAKLLDVEDRNIIRMAAAESLQRLEQNRDAPLPFENLMPSRRNGNRYATASVSKVALTNPT